MTEQVTNRQIFFILFITLTGYSVIELPKTMAQTSGTGAWLTLMLSAVIFSILASIIAYLNFLFEGKTLVEYSNILVGKFITFFFSLIYFVYFTTVVAMLNRAAAEVIRIDLLFKTPIPVTMFIMLIFSGYAASKGITNVGRILEYFGLIIILLVIFIHIAMFSQGDLMNIRPFYDSAEAKQYITALPDTVLYFLGFELLTVIPFTKVNNKKAIGQVVRTILFVGVFYVIIVETCFMVLSIEDAKNYTYALIVAMRRVEIKQLQFLIRLDIIFFMAWIFAIFSTFTTVIFAATSYFNKLFPSLNNKWSLIIVLAISYLIGGLLSNMNLVNQIITIAINKLGIIPAGGIPIILLIMAKVKKYA